MHINTCFALLLLAIALAQAGPAPRIIEKKSLAEDTKLETKKADLKIEETGEDKDRAKKSATTFCVQINPDSTQTMQVPCSENQAAAQRMPVMVQSQSVPQQIQAMNLVPQPVLQPFNTLQIVQPAAQPCMQSAPAVNIIQSIPQSRIIQHIPKPKPKPKPTPAPAMDIETITEAPQPERIEQFPQALPEPQETLAVMPYAPTYTDHLITIPSSPLMLMTEPEPARLATIIQVPTVSSCSNPMHGVVSPCTCQSNVAEMNEPNVESMKMKMPVMSYSSPYVSNMVQRAMTQQRAEQQGRHNTHINVRIPKYRNDHDHHDHHDCHDHHHQTHPDTYVNTAGTVPPKPVTDQVQQVQVSQTQAASGQSFGANAVDKVFINPYPSSYRDIPSMVQAAQRSSGNTLCKPVTDQVQQVQVSQTQTPSGRHFYANEVTKVHIKPYSSSHRDIPSMVQTAQRSSDNTLWNASNNPVPSGVTYFEQTKKAPREIDSNQLAPGKVEEIETQKGQALLIDGRRNARSNKEEAKDKKSVSATS